MRMGSSPENGVKGDKRSRRSSSSSKRNSSRRGQHAHRHDSHNLLNNINDTLPLSRSSVDFDFVQSVDLAELQRSGKIKRSKSISAAASGGGGSGRSGRTSDKGLTNGRSSSIFRRRDRRSDTDAASATENKLTSFRSRLAGSMSITRSSSSKHNSGRKGPNNNGDSDGDENDDQSVAAAVAALTLDPDLAREALHFSTSRHSLLGPGELAQDSNGHTHTHSHRTSVADGGADNSIGAVDGERDVGRLAAVCMAVGVGSLSDPDGLNGMAHFLEHMLSMGSDAFPLENDFESFLSRNGGRYNAFTESEETVFFFEVREDALTTALEMFGSFFVSPLLRLESAEREVNSVQSELSLLMNNDDFRIAQVWRETSKPGTPYENFNVGSNATLEPLLTDLSPMRKFYEKFYTAKNMKLTVFTTEGSASSSALSSSIDNPKQAVSVSKVIHDTIVRVFSGVKGEPAEKPIDPTRSHKSTTSFANFGMPWGNDSELPHSGGSAMASDRESNAASGTGSHGR
jgi:hypothetical protein